MDTQNTYTVERFNPETETYEARVRCHSRDIAEKFIRICCKNHPHDQFRLTCNGTVSYQQGGHNGR